MLRDFVTLCKTFKKRYQKKNKKKKKLNTCCPKLLQCITLLLLLGNDYNIRMCIRLVYSMFMCNEQRSSKANLNAVLQLYCKHLKKL